MMPTLSSCTPCSIFMAPRLPRPHKCPRGRPCPPRPNRPLVIPGFIPRNGFLVSFNANAAAGAPAPTHPSAPRPSYRLQRAQQNPLSELPISSCSFACFLTSGSRQAQAEISDIPHTHRNSHTLMRVGSAWEDSIKNTG